MKPDLCGSGVIPPGIPDVKPCPPKVSMLLLVISFFRLVVFIDFCSDNNVQLNSDTFFFSQKRKFPYTDTDFSIEKKSADVLSSEPLREHYGKARMTCRKVIMFSFRKVIGEIFH